MRVFSVASTSLAFSAVLSAQAGDTTAIQAKLSSLIKVTTVANDRSDIVTAGDVVQLHKPGLIMYGVASPLPPSNNYKNGKIGQGMGGFGKDLLIGMLTPGGTTPAATYSQRQFVPDEKCWVTGFQAQKDGILIQLYSDPYDGVRYYANLKIPFPNKKEIPSVDAAMQLVAEVLTVVPPDNQGGQPNQGGPPEQGGQPAVVAGQYFLKETGAQLTLMPEGSFTLLAANGQQSPGLFTVNGDALTLTYGSTGHSAQFKIQGNTLITDRGLSWVRTGDGPAPGGPTEGSTQGGQPPAIPGEYSAAGGSRLLLLPDGSFTKFVAGGQGKGQYTANGDTLTLTFSSTGFSQKFKTQSGNLLDLNTNQLWARIGDAPLPDIAPPPPPADTQTPTISVGQTKNQLTTAFGQPIRTVKIGVKEIYFYKDMKVTFLNGKVSNVE
jgi:hypothetical protein